MEVVFVVLREGLGIERYSAFRYKVWREEAASDFANACCRMDMIPSRREMIGAEEAEKASDPKSTKK